MVLARHNHEHAFIGRDGGLLRRSDFHRRTRRAWAGGRAATAYLWERVWEKHAWLNIIGRLMIVETKAEWDVATRDVGAAYEHALPAVPPVRAVTNIVAAVREEGWGIAT